MDEHQKQFDEPEVRARIVALAEKYHLSLVLLFGSQATGKTHKQSDYDVAYLSECPLTLMEESSLIVDLMPIFGTDAVDLISIHNASPLLAYEIARSAKTLYERIPGLFTSFYLYSLRQYEETKPLFELRSVYLDRKIAELKVAH
jgi:predicted nucleotidyltransferase